MKDIIMLYEDCCIYEIVILNYFLKFTNSEMLFCSVHHGKTIRSMEGYSMNCDISLEELDFSSVRSLIVPGGIIKNIEDQKIFDVIGKLNERKVLIAGICAGVNLLDEAGILKDIRSTHSVDADCVRDGNVITARANAYVDFAIEAAKALDLFEDEADLQETIDFWKYYKRAQ